MSTFQHPMDVERENTTLSLRTAPSFLSATIGYLIYKHKLLLCGVYNVDQMQPKKHLCAFSSLFMTLTIDHLKIILSGIFQSLLLRAG